MATRLIGPTEWSMTRDRDGNREYKIKWRIACDPGDGPANALQTTGLPQPGEYYSVLGDNDSWATCKLDATVTPVVTGEKNTYFLVEQTFSSKGDDKRCKDQQIDDPLLIPDRISGSFAKYQEEATTDLWGKRIQTSSFETLRGPQVEFDANRPTIKIEQNRAALELDLVAQMIDCVNDAPLWGLPPRCIKLDNFSWERKFYGNCYIYYSRNLEFGLRYPKFGSASDLLGFDRLLLDEGSKALNGHWDRTTGRWVLEDIAGMPPNPHNPASYVKVVDRKGNPMKAILDGAGVPIQIPLEGTITTVSPDVPPIVGTDAPHGLVTGDTVTISGATFAGSLDIEGLVNGTWKVAVVDSTHFTLVESEGLMGADYDAGSATWNFIGTPAGNVLVQKYPYANFLLLGIPTDLGTPT